MSVYKGHQHGRAYPLSGSKTNHKHILTTRMLCCFVLLSETDRVSPV